MTKMKKETKKKKKPITLNQPITLKKDLQDTQLKILWKSISGNYIFFLVLFFCLYKFTQNKKYNSSYIQLILSFLVVSFIGHFSHYISHHINFEKFYNNCDNILTRNKYTNKIIENFFYFLDFHDKTHHDTSINKQMYNIFFEFINNVVTQGVGIILFIKLIDIRVILLWAFMYSTIHNINYLFISPTTHRDHHLNSHTNYGIDYVDILLNTKYDWNDIETHNHGAFNLLIITYIIMYFTE
jgi:hypothetical protein